MVDRASLEAKFRESSNEALRVVATSGDHTPLAREVARAELASRGEVVPADAPIVERPRTPIFTSSVLGAIGLAIALATLQAWRRPPRVSPELQQLQDFNRSVAAQQEQLRGLQAASAPVMQELARCREEIASGVVSPACTWAVPDAGR